MRVDRKLPLPWGQACGASEEGKRKHAACRDPGVSITDRKQTRARGVQQRYLAASAGSRSGPPAGRKLFGRLRKLRRRAFRQEEIFLWGSGEHAGASFSVPRPCRPVTSIGNRPVAHALMRAVPALMPALVAAPPSVHTSVDAARTSACATTVQNQQLQPWVTGELALGEPWAQAHGGTLPRSK